MDANCIVCMRVADSHFQLIVQGSIKMPCSQCKELVFLSKSGQQMLKESPESIIVCMECVDISQVDKITLVSGAIKEASNHDNYLNSYHGN